VGVVIVVNGNREWWEGSVGLVAKIGDVVGVIELQRIGDEPFSLFRISCSYKNISWCFLRIGDFSGLIISLKPVNRILPVFFFFIKFDSVFFIILFWIQ
jgi:hypothetical protein